jgi:sugar/nucleoside kinase (ribokinase family)
MKEQLDFLAIGDTVTDAFIQLSDAWVDKDGESAKKGGLCVTFGDKVPFESVEIVRAVGNSANAAVSAARLGLKTGLVSWLGDDEEGAKCRESLRKDGVDDTYVTTEAGKPTNYHFVLRFGAERTILIKHTDWSYVLPAIDPAPKWIYLSSFAPSGATLHDQIADYLEAHPETKLAFQPGVFDIKQGVERLKRIYARADIFFCNKEEAERILGVEPAAIPELLPKMRALGPKSVVITDGPNGAFAQDVDGAIYRVPMFPDRVPAVDRTGAGDATGSTVTAALALGFPLAEALRWGPVNSASVVEKIGAQAGLLSRAELESRLAATPSHVAERLG